MKATPVDPQEFGIVQAALMSEPLSLTLVEFASQPGRGTPQIEYSDDHAPG